MRLHPHRRLIAACALLAFLFATAYPALAMVRQAVDPAAFATICRVDNGTAGDSAPPGPRQSRLESAHCLMCLGTVSPPPALDLVPQMVLRVEEPVLPATRTPLPARDPAAFQPLNPRAPPRA